jgi:hypothetical protein
MMRKKEKEEGVVSEEPGQEAEGREPDPLRE